jgi:hypothetical protein
MTVDSVMELSPVANGYMWQQATNLEATQSKFSNGKYEWTGDVRNHIAEGQQPNHNKNYVTHIFGWAGPLGADLPSTSTQRTVQVKVTDANGTAPGELTNTYVIRYHLPVENAIEDTSRKRASGYNYQREASSWVAVNTPVSIIVKPANRWVRFLTKGGGLVLEVAGAVLGATAIFASGGSAAPYAPAILGTLTAAGITLGNSAPEDITSNPNFSYAMYQDAVNIQHKIDNPQLYPGQAVPTYRRVFPPELTNVAKLGMTGPKREDFDPTWKNSMLKGRVVAARKWVETPKIGDEYNHNGYVDRKIWTDRVEETHMYINQIWLPVNAGDPEPDRFGSATEPTV